MKLSKREAYLPYPKTCKILHFGRKRSNFQGTQAFFAIISELLTKNFLYNERYERRTGVDLVQRKYFSGRLSKAGLFLCRA